MSKEIRCVIIDDEELSRTSLLRLCEKLDYLKVEATFSSAFEAIDFVKSRTDLDLLFLDIHMPELNGFEFIQTMKKVPKVIFTTSDPNHALQAFEVEAVDYLLKPVTFPRFLSAIERLKANGSSSESGGDDQYKNEIFVNTDKRLVRIPVDEISVIEVKGDYILIKMDETKMHVVRSTLKSIAGRLSPEKFIRVHRSYIVNLSKIVDIEDSSILVNNEIVPISRSYKSEVINRLNLL